MKLASASPLAFLQEHGRCFSVHARLQRIQEVWLSVEGQAVSTPWQPFFESTVLQRCQPEDSDEDDGGMGSWEPGYFVNPTSDHPPQHEAHTERGGSVSMSFGGAPALPGSL